MSKQKKDFKDVKHGEILDFEKKYMEKLSKMIESETFKEDLKKIECAIKVEYNYLTILWNKKNKIKEASERLVRHHVYNALDNIIGFYPYPASSDIALELNDVIINIDIKTIDKQKNKGELTSIAFEHNQTSFENKPLFSDELHGGVKAQSSIPVVDQNTGKYVLTYLIKIGYFDNGVDTFELINEDNTPSVVLVCLPNGALSYLFDYNLITNFKTYKYYTDVQDIYFKSKIISTTADYNNREDMGKYGLMKRNANIPNNWKKTKIGTGRRKRLGFYDEERQVLWITITKSDGHVYLSALECGNTGRFNTKWIKERYDSNKDEWSGIKNFYNITK